VANEVSKRPIHFGLRIFGLLKCPIHFGLGQVQTKYSQPFRAPAILFFQKTDGIEMGSRWLADRSIPFLSIRTGEKKQAAQKTEIHSTMGTMALKDLADPQGIEQVRHWYDNSEHKIEQCRKSENQKIRKTEKQKIRKAEKQESKEQNGLQEQSKKSLSLTFCHRNLHRSHRNL
jgi:hypothetical protein